MKMPPKKENSNNNNKNVETVGNEHTAAITVSSTSSNNNNNCIEKNNSNNNSHHSNATVITSLATRSATAAMNVCSSSSNNTNTNSNNNNNHNSNSNNHNNNNNQNNNSTTTMADNGSINQSLCVNDIAAEQRTIAYQANAKLCRLVRKCPWMYDRNHHNYAKKHILDKSWTKIAKECNDSVVSCKERWRNIRAAFARSINIYKTHSGPNRVKPYYLHKELTFLVKPMMEGRDKKDEFEEDSRPDIETNGGVEVDVGGATEEEDDDDEELDQEDDDQDDPDEVKSTFEAFKPTITIHTEEYPLKNNIRMIQGKIYCNSSPGNNNHNNYECNSIYDQQNEFPSISDAEAEFNFSNENGRHTDRQFRNGINLKRSMDLTTDSQYDAKRTRLTSSNNLAIQEADVRFLEAVLPDMALMNTRQKIIFKRKLYQTLEEVLENSANFPCYQETPQNDMQSHNHMNTTKCNNGPTSSGNNNIGTNNNYININSTNSNSQNNVGMSTSTPTTTATTLGTGNQVRQTILTVNSSMARTLINNIAQLSETELHKVSGFLQTHLRNHNMTGRLTNGPQMAASGAAAHLMHTTPKITITKVTCPPPSAFRNLNTNSSGNNNCSQTIATPSAVQLSTPTVSTSALATQTIVHSTGIIHPNVHSTTTAVTAGAGPGTVAVAAAAASTPITTNTRFQMANNLMPTVSHTINNNNCSNNQNGAAAWNPLLPITIKDEVEDVDID